MLEVCVHSVTGLCFARLHYTALQAVLQPYRLQVPYQPSKEKFFMYLCTAAGDKAPADEAAREAALSSRKGQLCFVHMASAEAADAVVRALDGHTVQGSRLEARFGRAPSGSRKKEGSDERQEAEASAAAAE